MQIWKSYTFEGIVLNLELVSGVGANQVEFHCHIFPFLALFGSDMEYNTYDFTRQYLQR